MKLNQLNHPPPPNGKPSWLYYYLNTQSWGPGGIYCLEVYYFDLKHRPKYAWASSKGRFFFGILGLFWKWTLFLYVFSVPISSIICDLCNISAAFFPLYFFAFMPVRRGFIIWAAKVSPGGGGIWGASWDPEQGSEELWDSPKTARK